MLGSLFFVLFIDDLVRAFLPEGVAIMLYANDAKLYLVYPPAEWTPLLQRALEMLEKWSVSWELRLAVPKCQLFFLGGKMQSTLINFLGRTQWQCQLLGTLVFCCLSSWFPHISAMAAKASKCANAILRSFTYSDFQLLARAYVTYVHPILEAASSVWSPHLKQDKLLVESVQRRFSKRLFCKCNLQPTTYENRLAILGWPSLEARRNRADLILMFRIVKGLANSAGSLSIVHEKLPNLRGNAFRLKGSLARLDIRKYFFVHRIVERWNALRVDHTKVRNISAFCAFLTQNGY